MKTTPRFLLAAALSLLASAHAARAATVINSVPYTITQSGDYELGANFNYNAANGAIITVNASNVTIDFKGFYISGPVGNAGQTVYGIFATERSNLTIVNGTIAYCYTGVRIEGNNSGTTNNVGHRVKRMRITYCTSAGIYFAAEAPGSVVSDCQISKIGGSTLSANSSGTGITTLGSGVTLRSNIISDITSLGAGNAVGIIASNGVFCIRNTIANAQIGIQAGKYQNNLTSNVATPFFSGTNAGGNN